MTPTTPSIELPHKAYILPQAVPMWPPAWWTWLALAVIIVLLIGIIALALKRRKKRTYRREALVALKQADDNLLDKELIVLCHELVRRCLVSENKLALAALPASDLFKILDEKSSIKRRFESLGDDFMNGPYRAQVELDSAQRAHILTLTRYWIRKHHA